MTQEELKQRLIELLKPCMSGCSCEHESGSCEFTDCRSCNARNLADNLIANGVTIRERGEWKTYPSDAYMKCSVCGMEYLKTRMPQTVGYCPNPHCGADMRGEKDE